MKEYTRRVKSVDRYVTRRQGDTSIITVEHRSNNSKRDFLFVNKQQCKHIPASPKGFMYMVNSLAEMYDNIRENKDARVVVIGFAETATAIATYLAMILGEQCEGLICTTRETPYIKENGTDVGENKSNGGVAYETVAEFLEEHSHAPSQSLIMRTMNGEPVINFESATHIIVIDDEITTGKTVLNLKEKLEEKFDISKAVFLVGSICNWQDTLERDNFWHSNIMANALINGNIKDKSMKMFDDANDDRVYVGGDEIKVDISDKTSNAISIVDCRLSRQNRTIEQTNKERNGSNGRVCIEFFNYARYGLSGSELKKGGFRERQLFNEIKQFIPKGVSSIRVIGTEECMILPILIGSELEYYGYSVICHSSTRSKIDVIRDYAHGEADTIKSIHQVTSVYDENRPCYIYNTDEETDMVIVISDTPNEQLLNTFVRQINELVTADKVIGVRV